MNTVLDYKFKYNKINNKYSLSVIRSDEVLKDQNLGDALMNLLSNGDISTVFQPIVSLKDSSILGYEALSRGPANSLLENPTTLFDVARVYSKLWELEFLCRIKALENSSKKNMGHTVFLNVDPDIINDDKFKKGFTKQFLKQYNIDPENIVFEITEKNFINDVSSFRKLINNYTDQGYKIAIDDTGAGYSGLKLITDIHPHYIKLDMNLIRDIDKDGMKHALIKTFYEFCLVTDIKLIAEGIETTNELNTLIDIGIDYGQGYYIQKPKEKIIPIKNEIKEQISYQNRKKSKLYYSRPSTVNIGDISTNSKTVSPFSTGENVLEIFENNPTIYGIPVVDNDTLIGLVMRDKFFYKLGTQYGFSLFLKRSVTLVIDRRPLTVDYNMQLDVVSKISMNRHKENLYDYIIVTKNNKYYGIVTVKELLIKTTELEVNYAKHLNPLTGLPGNILIEHKLNKIIQVNQPYTILYIDMDNFKVYNDIYGFENGDRMIEFLSRILINISTNECKFENFIGHIGGDDFIMIFHCHELDSICESILKAFDNGIANLYTNDHQKNHCILSKNRKGEDEQYGLVTLSIACVSNKNRYFKDVYELSEFAVKVKGKCKENFCSCYVIE